MIILVNRLKKLFNRFESKQKRIRVDVTFAIFLPDCSV